MLIKAARPSDATVIHSLMIQAYKEYENETPSSSALEETVQSVKKNLQSGEKAFITYEGKKPLGMVRFRIKSEELYFYRLSVIPDQQGKGIAKKMLAAIEDYALNNKIDTLSCKVRKSMPRNVHLYRSLNYQIVAEQNIPLTSGQVIEAYVMKKDLHV